MSTEDSPVISMLNGFTWSNEETAAYEAAIEAANAVVGAYSARIAAEQAKAEPDTSAIDTARTARADIARQREALDPANHAQIASARRRFSELAREIREDIR